MRSKRYLNFILTVIAVLLAAHLWTDIASRPLLAEEATAQAMGRVGFPTNAAAERREANKLLRDMAVAVEAQTSLLRSGDAKVRVVNLHEVPQYERK